MKRETGYGVTSKGYLFSRPLFPVSTNFTPPHSHSLSTPPLPCPSTPCLCLSPSNCVHPFPLFSLYPVCPILSYLCLLHSLSISLVVSLHSLFVSLSFHSCSFIPSILTLASLFHSILSLSTPIPVYSSPVLSVHSQFVSLRPFVFIHSLFPHYTHAFSFYLISSQTLNPVSIAFIHSFPFHLQLTATEHFAFIFTSFNVLFFLIIRLHCSQDLFFPSINTAFPFTTQHTTTPSVHSYFPDHQSCLSSSVHPFPPFSLYPVCLMSCSPCPLLSFLLFLV